MSIRVLITIWVIIFLLCCLFGVWILLSYNQIHANAKDRSYVYNDMRPTRQQRSSTLNEMIKWHPWRPSEQQTQFLQRILSPLADWSNSHDMETEIMLLNTIIEAAPALLASYWNVRQDEHQEIYSRFLALTQELASKKRHYNMLAKQYNISINTFPWSLISFGWGYKDVSLFFLSAEEKQWVPAETVW